MKSERRAASWSWAGHRQLDMQIPDQRKLLVMFVMFVPVRKAAEAVFRESKLKVLSVQPNMTPV